mgnify:CR=1 FL=1
MSVSHCSGESKWELVTSLDLPWYVLLGKAALLLAPANVLLSLLQLRIGLKFGNWRRLHGVIGPLPLVLAFTLSYVIEARLRSGPLKDLDIPDSRIHTEVFSFLT